MKVLQFGEFGGGGGNAFGNVMGAFLLRDSIAAAATISSCCALLLRETLSSFARWLLPYQHRWSVFSSTTGHGACACTWGYLRPSNDVIGSRLFGTTVLVISVRSSFFFFFFSFSVIGVLVLVCNCGICKGRKGGRRCSRVIGKIKALSEGWRLAYIFCVKEFKENVATFEENCTVVVLS